MKKIGKFLTLVLALLLIVGCDTMKDSPTKKVEDLLNKYKNKDASVLVQLESVIEDAGTMNDIEKVEYRKLMERQYENMNYKIKEEKIDGNKATVVVEIEVYDYGKAITESENYLTNNKSEFQDEETGIVDSTKFLDYKIKKMGDIADRITYTINFSLIKEEKDWKIEDLGDMDRLKIHGLYY